MTEIRPKIETKNEFLAARAGDNVRVLLPYTFMTREQALRLAAWLVVLADDNDEFEQVLMAVQNT